jgi:hypothetical protein
MRFQSLRTFIVIGLTCMSCAEERPPSGEGPWLLGALQTIADEGALFNSSRIENLLRLKLAGEEEEYVSQPPNCSDDWANRSVIVKYHRSTPEWLKPSSDVVKHDDIPTLAINPAVGSANPALTYRDTMTKSRLG